jgi:rhamnogalacturonyl hydrolase YesR
MRSHYSFLFGEYIVFERTGDERYLAYVKNWVDSQTVPLPYRGVMSKGTMGRDSLTNVSDICEGTNVGDLAYYLGRKHRIDDFHGIGALLLMNEHAITSKSSMQLDARNQTPANRELRSAY